MGRAIDTEKDIDMLKRDVAQLKTAFEGLASTVETLNTVSTTRTNVDLHETTDSRNEKAEGKKPSKKKRVVEKAEA